MFLILWCPEMIGPGKIYATHLKAQDRLLKEGRSISWRSLPLVINTLPLLEIPSHVVS